jgi:signal transduction histidine kinase
VTEAQVDILLVDDQPARLLTYEAILRPLGHRLVTADSGVAALERLMEREFAVILLDVSMPDMDGFETARLIHQHPRFENTPIIFVTGVHVTELDRLKGYELGAVDYVYVPVVPEILRSKVSVLVELHSKRQELQALNYSLEKANAELARANEALQREKEGEIAKINRVLEQANRELGATNAALTLEINERRRAEQALMDADRRKDDFLAILAHELRNPLAPIRNAIEVMQRHSEADAMIGQLREVIARQVLHMTRLIDDLLDVSRITQGKINLKPEPTDLRNVLQRAVETAQPLIRARGHELVLDQPGEEVPVNGDAVRLAQVIGNLVNNAAKYTPESGKIEITLKTTGNSAVISVRDNGIGIANEQLARVFDLFGQVQTPRPHNYDGLGIGLALVRRLVEMHHGSVEASSDGLDKGSEFVVRLPLLQTQELAPQVVEAHADDSGPGGRRILVVDDHADCLESLAMLLRLSGNEVRTASDGQEAVDIALEFAPDIVLLDIRMPKMDGYEAARRLRMQPRGKDMVIIALTGWGQQEHRERSRAAGFDAHLTKPLDHDVLTGLIGSIAKPATLAAVTTAA